jgi:hypothetical protein
VPPDQWALTRTEEHTWYMHLEKIIHAEIKSILDLGVAYLQDLRAHFS